MPAALERKLRQEATQKHLSKESSDAYVYGTMRKTGWKPKREVHIPGGSMHELVVLDSNVGTAHGGAVSQPNPKDRNCR